jgi:hypothetical protein
VPKAAGRKFHARREPELRVARQLLVELAIVEQLLRGHCAFQHGQQILRRHAMACFVKERVVDRRAAGDERADDVDLRHVVVRPTRMAGEAFRIRDGGEKDDHVAAELDVVLERRLLLRRQRRARRVKLEGLQCTEIDGKVFGGHRSPAISSGRAVVARLISDD